MKHILSLVLFLGLAFQTTAFANEDWKGHTETSQIEIGALTGVGIEGTDTSWSVLGTAAYLLVPHGWASDIDNRVWVEGELGPSFFNDGGSSHSALQYAAQLRWDFTLNEEWTFYGLGGLGGFVLPDYLGRSFAIHPRFGAGAEYQTKTAIMFRAEVASDLLALGIAFNF
jgi:hypothetical protein